MFARLSKSQVCSIQDVQTDPTSRKPKKSKGWSKVCVNYLQRELFGLDKPREIQVEEANKDMHYYEIEGKTSHIESA